MERVATYRLQLHGGFGFLDAAAAAGYLKALGVSHLYLSPVLQAAKGSTHGYDVTDPSRISGELGGEKGWRALLDAAHGLGLGWLADVVPNHMAIGSADNRWWWDVLENGASSAYAAYFDVDWHPGTGPPGRIVLPVLGDHYGRELDAGRLVVARKGHHLAVTYFDQEVPVSPRTLDSLLARAAARLPRGDVLGPRSQMEYLAAAFGRLPVASSTGRASVAERHRDKEILGARLGDLLCGHAEAAAALDAEVAALNASADALDAFLLRQNYRLAWWRSASEELGYRRFFDINGLAAIRVEDPRVFADSHRLPLRWLREGDADGLRIDHIDGLWDPAGYLARLAAAAPDAWIVVEKVLQPGERLPAGWPVAGTTGYDWLALVDGLCTDRAGAEALTAAYRVFSGDTESYEDQVAAAKREALSGPLAADLGRAVGRLAAFCGEQRRYRDYTRRELGEVLGEMVAALPVYRTYAAGGTPAGPAGRGVLRMAAETVRGRHPGIDSDLLEFVTAVLAGEAGPPGAYDLAGRVQQLSGAVMAKAVEDTVFYRYPALLCRNEVGADPGAPPAGLDDFHRLAAEHQRNFPHSLLATSTHDTKRAEDVRARLAVLAEMPDEWVATVERWGAADRPGRPAGAEAGIDRATEWLLYQTLFGAWPIAAPRLLAYLEKAVREAKVHTSWTDPDAEYEAAVRHFAVSCLESPRFVEEMDGLVNRLRRFGWSNGLAAKLLTLLGPGIPDLYQGSELWDLSLVDPDNRRQVDYGERRALLRRVRSVPAPQLWAHEDGSGAAKLAVVHAALAVRREHAAAFGAGRQGAYLPLAAEGPAAAHAVASVRGGQVVVAATRLPLGLARRGGWGTTVLPLPAGRWTGRLDSGTWEGKVPLAALLAALPVAVLVADG